MDLKHSALAGTLESSDALVRVEPQEGLDIELESSVMAQFGKQLQAVIQDTLQRLEVTNAKVIIQDQGALDCTLRSRIETAVFRAVDQDKDIPWEVLQ